MRLFGNFDINPERNIDPVLTKLGYARGESQLPAEVRNYGVTVQKSLTTPFLYLALSAPAGTHDSQFLANYAYINLNDAITRVQGVASVTVFGAGQYAMRLWVKPDQLAKLNITLPVIISAVNSHNAVNPARRIGRQTV